MLLQNLPGNRNVSAQCLYVWRVLVSSTGVRVSYRDCSTGVCATLAFADLDVPRAEGDTEQKVSAFLLFLLPSAYVIALFRIPMEAAIISRLVLANTP